ncbi:MAG TPA: carboxypeptidase-like regulatory domain-containing protein [Nannocystaceae bacterium]|nr:carboxypeptidase-like regulatory domain-containing protein [Nannocystaceae bacterium]
MLATLACVPDFGDLLPDHPVDRTPRVAGTVLDAEGAALADVRVLQGDRELGTTDARGRFEVSASAGDTVVLQFRKDGYVRGLERVQVAEAPTAMRVTLLDEAPAMPFDSDAGGKVVGLRGASIEAMPGSFVDRQGNAIGGMVDVHLTALNPGVQAELAAYPGDGRARTSGGDTVQLETFGVVDVTVRQGDTDLTIADGMGVVVEFPLPDPMPAEPPATIALWGFDDATGEWTEEGVATLDLDRGVYVGTITHLSPWNCDQPLEATCVKGHVRDESGDGIPGAYVIARGLDYTGDSAATSGEDGEFCVPVKKDSRVEITAHLPGGQSETREVQSGSADTDVPAACNDPRCLDAGDWVFPEGAGDEEGWQGGEACNDADDSHLAMQLDGFVQDDIDWSGSAWFATCGALSGSTGSGSTFMMFQDEAMSLGVGISLEVDEAQTADGVVTSVYLFDQLNTDASQFWYAEDCVADVTRNEVLAPGMFRVAGSGHCNAPAVDLYGSTEQIDIVGTFAFEGVVINGDVASEVIYECCIGYW